MEIGIPRKEDSRSLRGVGIGESRGLLYFFFRPFLGLSLLKRHREERESEVCRGARGSSGRERAESGAFGALKALFAVNARQRCEMTRMVRGETGICRNATLVPLQWPWSVSYVLFAKRRELAFYLPGMMRVIWAWGSP